MWSIYEAEFYPRTTDAYSAVERMRCQFTALAFEADYETVYGLGRWHSEAYLKYLGLDNLRTVWWSGNSQPSQGSRATHSVKSLVKPPQSGTIDQPINAPAMPDDMFTPEQSSFLEKLFKDLLATMREKEIYYSVLLDPHIALQKEFAEFKSTISAATENEASEITAISDSPLKSIKAPLEQNNKHKPLEPHLKLWISPTPSRGNGGIVESSQQDETENLTDNDTIHSPSGETPADEQNEDASKEVDAENVQETSQDTTVQVSARATLKTGKKESKWEHYCNKL
ncbi:hypothetical protein FQA39_LY02792 [Lamprigera yunnana]|nr:hypothetical protein FQA39_LY02792 [Lamprigera yunnana]